MKRFLLIICFAATNVFGYSQIRFVTATDAAYVLPAGWNNSDNLIECIGRGGSGSTRVSSSQGGNGGGAGAYASKTNVTLDLGSGQVGIIVGTASSVTVTSITDSGGTTQVVADYGRNATAVNNGAGAGGTVGNSTGTVRNPGGNGGNSVVGDAGGGGGGSGGPSGSGGNGAVGAIINGGSADGGVVGQQTTQGQPGNAGTEWDSTHGCGGGGAGGVGGGSRSGGGGAIYGGGGGGSDSGTAAAGPATGGMVIIQWNPAVAPNTNFLQMFSMILKPIFLWNWHELAKHAIQ